MYFESLKILFKIFDRMTKNIGLIKVHPGHSYLFWVLEWFSQQKSMVIHWVQVSLPPPRSLFCRKQSSYNHGFQHIAHAISSIHAHHLDLPQVYLSLSSLKMGWIIFWSRIVTITQLSSYKIQVKLTLYLVKWQVHKSNQLWHLLRVHTHMMSDVFEWFLTCLTTLIRYFNK